MKYHRTKKVISKRNYLIHLAVVLSHINKNNLNKNTAFQIVHLYLAISDKCYPFFEFEK